MIFRPNARDANPGTRNPPQEVSFILQKRKLTGSYLRDFMINLFKSGYSGMEVAAVLRRLRTDVQHQAIVTAGGQYFIICKACKESGTIPWSRAQAIRRDKSINLRNQANPNSSSSSSLSGTENKPSSGTEKKPSGASRRQTRRFASKIRLQRSCDER